MPKDHCTPDRGEWQFQMLDTIQTVNGGDTLETQQLFSKKEQGAMDLRKLMRLSRVFPLAVDAVHLTKLMLL